MRRGLRESEWDPCSPNMTRVLRPVWPEMAIIRFHSQESHDIVLTLSCSLGTVVITSVSSLSLHLVLTSVELNK